MTNEFGRDPAFAASPSSQSSLSSPDGLQSGVGITVWRNGSWTILHVRTGGAETTSSLTPKQAHDLAYELLNGGSLLPALTEICDRYAEDPDTTDDQAEIAAGICVDIEELLNGPVVPGHIGGARP